MAGQGGVELGQGGQAGPRAVGLADRDGPVEAGHRVVGEAHQFVVPLDDLHPVGLLGRPGVGVERGDGGLGLELAEAVAGEGWLEHVDALGDQAGVPQAAVLLGKRHEPAVTYSFSWSYVNPGTAMSLQIGGLTNTAAAVAYAPELTTNGSTAIGPASSPIDTGLTAVISIGPGAMVNPNWTVSKTNNGATGVVYGYSFSTATSSTLSSVTMTVPSGTAGTPIVGAVSGLPGAGTISLSGNVLTYSFTPTQVSSGTVISIAVGGMTNTSVAGSTTAELATVGTNVSGATLPVDTGMTALVSMSPGVMTNPQWTDSKSSVGATGVTYGYSFTTPIGATLTTMTAPVPVGTPGTPTVGPMTGVPSNGTVSLSGNVLTYSFPSIYLNPGTAVSVQINGLTNTSTAGSYSAELTTKGSTVGGPSLPIDTGLTGSTTLR